MRILTYQLRQLPLYLRRFLNRRQQLRLPSPQPLVEDFDFGFKFGFLVGQDEGVGLGEVLKFGEFGALLKQFVVFGFYGLDLFY
jgi:hypothetical protein